MQQHDVQELNRILFDALESSLVGTSGEKFISHLYHGTSVQQVSTHFGTKQTCDLVAADLFRNPIKFGILEVMLF